MARKLIDKYEDYFEDIIELYDITAGGHTLRVVITHLGATEEGGDIVEGFGATVEIISRENELINKIFDEMKNDYEETDLWTDTTYNCAVEVWTNASFTTYSDPDDIEVIIKTAEAIARGWENGK